MKTNFIKEHYHIIVPILISFLVYSISLFYGFRNFDEDVIIKNFYVNKTFSEYIEKYLLLGSSGLTEAHGFTFSSVKNVHFCLLERPVFYLVNFLFHANPFLFHLLSLVLHMLVVYFFSLFCYNLTQNKKVACFSSLIWSIHPTNVEPVIWATNWPALIGAILYFYTLNKISSSMQKGSLQQAPTFIVIITLIQILFIEHTITIPLAIFLTVLYQNKDNFKNSFIRAYKTSIYSFITVFIYFILRFFITLNISGHPHIQNNLKDFSERVIFFTPQVFFHQLKLIFFPNILTIDQIDHLNLDANYFGIYHLSCIFVLILFLLLVWITKNKLTYLSYGLLLYLVSTLPFLQIIPLYSLVAERYNYFGSTFIVFGVISTLYTLFKNSIKLFTIFSIIICLSLGIRTYERIPEWKNSKTLFLSTINASKSLLKKGIWTYNLAISEKDENKKIELLNLSSNLLVLYIQNYIERSEPNVLKSYELDSKSLTSKAALRTSTNYEILKNKDLQLKYLLAALDFARLDSQIQSLIYKNLGTFYFQENDFIKAIDFYSKSNLISNNPMTNYAIAVCYLRLKDFLNYEKYLKLAASIASPSNIGPHKSYGQLLEYTKNDFKGAIKYYKIASLLENSSEPYILLGTLYLKLKEIDNALKYTERGLYSFPEDPTLLYLKGTIEISKGKASSGINNLIKATNSKECPPDIRIEAYNILVNIFSVQKDFQNALKYNDLALKLNPTNQEARKIQNDLKKYASN